MDFLILSTGKPFTTTRVSSIYIYTYNSQTEHVQINKVLITVFAVPFHDSINKIIRKTQTAQHTLRETPQLENLHLSCLSVCSAFLYCFFCKNISKASVFGSSDNPETLFSTACTESGMLASKHLCKHSTSADISVP